MNWKYKRDFHHTYLILFGSESGSSQYQECMLEKNRIEGLLPCQIRYIDAQKEYYYNISSKQTLQSVYAINKMQYTEFVRLIYEIKSVIQEVEKYLLDSSRLLLSADTVYWDLEKEKVWMIYYPAAVPEEGNLLKAGEDFLELIDYADEKAVDMAHYFYERSREENFCWDSIINYIEEKELEKEWQKEDAGMNRRVPQDSESSDKDRIRERQQREMPDSMEQEDTVCKKAGLSGGKISIMLKLLRKPAAILIILSMTGIYMWKNYLFTALEMTAGAFLLAAATAAVIIYTMLRWKKLQEAENSGDYPIRQEYNTAVKSGTEDMWSKENLPEADTGNRADNNIVRTTGKEEPEYYGETVCLSVLEEEEEERRLEGRIGGKEVFIFLDTMPFLVGKMKDRVSYTLHDASVSRLHAVFREEGGRIMLSDLQSKNGTFKNEVRLEAGEALEVKPGDEIRFGKLKFTYH